MKAQQIIDIEMDLFLTALNQRHGYDFSDYAKASLKRRINGLLSRSGKQFLSELIPPLLYENAFLTEIIASLSVQVSEMFRDPEVFLTLRRELVPVLKTYPQVNIWLAGCATGEEAYSLAILLREEGLFGRSRIYATDINQGALHNAQEGIYSLKHIQAYSKNYQKAGGKGSLADYYHAKYEFAKMEESLKEIIFFSPHNLTVDGVFCEAHLVLCRNVLIYFNQQLQNRVLQLFYESLTRGGYLCLGPKESLRFSSVVNAFKPVARKQMIFQKLAKGAKP